MPEILENELLIKGMGQKGWREVKGVCLHVCVCVFVQVSLRNKAQSKRGNDTSIQASYYLWTTDSHLSQ